MGKHKITMKDLIEQDFEIKVIIAASTKDKKKLEFVASHQDEYKPYFSVTVGKQVSKFSHILNAMEFYNDM